MRPVCVAADHRASGGAACVQQKPAARVQDARGAAPFKVRRPLGVGV